MLDLSTISFKVDTSELDRAGKAIGELVTNVGKLDKAARDAAQTEAVLAKAAKLNADANLQNAKAQDTRLKSTITADKADQQAADAIERKTKATERASTAIKKNADMLQLQNDTYDFILEGFSKGDAKVLAMAKATGQLSDQLKQVLTDIRQFSKNTFDQTETGLDRMVKSAKEASSAQGFLNNGLNLTSKQAKELSNDLDRLNIRLQHQGKSYQEITKEQAIYKQRFVEEANAVNRATSALAAVEKQRKDVVSATNYLTQAEAKMSAALNTSNAALDKAGTDSLVKYEAALRKSGVSQDVATQKLATYKSQLAQVAAAEEKRRAQHLTRALTPQISDVVVSLWSGQNPLTVLLQQGSQVNDMFQLSGVAAADFGKTVKEAFSSMLPSILTVVKGVGGLLVDGFVAAGNAVSSFLANAVGVAGALDKLYMKMSENGPSKWAGVIRGLSSLMSGVFAGGVAAGTAVLVAIGIALKQVISENDNLARSMAQSGASMAISTSQAFAYAKSMNDVDISTGKAVVAITEMAKAGNFASSDIPKVTEAAVNLNKYLGVSIEDTVKAYSKLKDEPVKAILDLAKASGNIPPKIIETIVELERQGEVAKATSIAMTARFENDKKVIEDAKKNLSGFSTFVISLGNTISNFFSNTFKNIWYATDPTDELQKNLDEVRKKIKDVSATLESNKSWGISGDPKLLNSLKEQERMIISQIGAQVRLRGEEEKRKFLNTENAKDQEAIAKIQKEAFAFASKETEKTLSLEAFKKKFVDDKIKATGRQVELDKQTLDLLNKQAEAEYKKLHASGAKQTVKDLETEIDILNKRVGLTSSYNNELASLQRLRASGVITEQEYIHDVEELIKLQPFYIDQQKKLAEAEEHRLKLLGKSEGIGKQYYSDMQKLEEFAKVAGWSREEIEELTRAVFMATPAWKAYEKALEEVNSAARKFNEDSITSQAATLKENESLDYRLSLLGKTAEEQKALSIEYNRANKLSEVRIKLAKQLRDIEADIEKAKKAGLPEEDYKNLIDAQVQARKDAAEQEKAINREVAVQYAEDLQKEFDAIKNGISDSIVTALFEGGKAGSKKFRDLVVAELRKPVTMVVNAVVNTILGNIVGSLMGGAAAGAAGGAAGGIGTSIAGSAVGGLFGGASSGILGGLSQGFGATMSNGLFGGFGVNMGNIGTLAGGGQWAAALGAAAPYLIAVTALLSLISSFDDSGTIHTGGAASYSVATGQRSGNSANQFGTGFGWVERGDQTISAMETLSKSLVEIFDGIAKTFGKTAGYEVAVAFADDTSGDGAWGAFAVRLQGVEILNWEDFRQSKWAPKEFGDGEEGYKQYLAAIAKDTRQVILDMDLPGWADQVLNDIGDAPSLESLSKAIQELAQMKAVYDLMTSQMVNFAGITDEAFGKLIKEFGDIGTMTNQVAGYYQNYYSEFERFNKAQADVTKSFTDLGLTMPTSREEFRKLAESQDLNTEAGRKMYAQLMALATSFGVVIDATEQLANARTDIVYRMMEQEAQLLAAQGRTVEADKKRREILDKQRAAEYERLMKVNPELARLTAELWALEDAAVAAANAAALEREISDTRLDYTDRILQQEAELLAAQGRTAEADKKRRELLDRQRARENERLMALSPELARLAYELWLLEDATVAAANAAALEREISDNRRDYTDRILQQEAALLDAQGRTAEADKKRRELLDRQRARENERLMKINPELAKLAYELWLLEDATAAATRAAALEREISDNRRDYTDRILQQEAELLDAQGRTAEADKKRRELLDRQRARENERLMALNPELAKLAYELWLLEDATEAATRAANERKEISDDLYNALVKAVDAEKTLLDEQKARLEETVSTLKAVFDILKSSVEDLYGEVSSTSAMQASEGRGVIAQAIATGILPDSKLLDTSIQAVRDEISNSLYVSKADADKARLIFAAQLALLKDTTEEQLTDAEKQLKAVNAQISYLDNILKTAKEQLDAFLGNTEVLKSVDKALADLYAFLQNPSAAKPVPKPVGTEKPGNNAGTGGGAVFGGSSGSNPTPAPARYSRLIYGGTAGVGYEGIRDQSLIDRLDKLSPVYHSFDGTGDLAGLAAAFKAAGGTIVDLSILSGNWESDWRKAFEGVGIPAFAEGGNYRGGVALVGEEGPELINFSNPGQVYTARQTASMLSGESSEVVAELKAVRSEIIMLRAEVRADVSHNAKTAKLLDRVIPEGDSVQVTIS